MDYKFINLRFSVCDMLVASQIHEQFGLLADEIGLTQMGVYPHSGDDKTTHKVDDNTRTVIIQLSNEGNVDQWEAAMSLCLELCNPNSPVLINMGFNYDQIEFVGMEVQGEGFTSEEKMVFTFIGGLTQNLLGAIIPILNESVTLRHQVETMQEELTQIKVQSFNNAQYITGIMNTMRTVAEKQGMDGDTLFEDVFVKIH